MKKKGRSKARRRKSRGELPDWVTAIVAAFCLLVGLWGVRFSFNTIIEQDFTIFVRHGIGLTEVPGPVAVLVGILLTPVWGWLFYWSFRLGKDIFHNQIKR